MAAKYRINCVCYKHNSDTDLTLVGIRNLPMSLDDLMDLQLDEFVEDTVVPHIRQYRPTLLPDPLDLSLLDYLACTDQPSLDSIAASSHASIHAKREEAARKRQLLTPMRELFRMHLNPKAVQLLIFLPPEHAVSSSSAQLHSSPFKFSQVPRSDTATAANAKQEQTNGHQDPVEDYGDDLPNSSSSSDVVVIQSAGNETDVDGDQNVEEEEEEEAELESTQKDPQVTPKGKGKRKRATVCWPQPSRKKRKSSNKQSGRPSEVEFETGMTNEGDADREPSVNFDEYLHNLGEGDRADSQPAPTEQPIPAARSPSPLAADPVPLPFTHDVQESPDDEDEEEEEPEIEKEPVAEPQPLISRHPSFNIARKKEAQRAAAVKKEKQAEHIPKNDEEAEENEDEDDDELYCYSVAPSVKELCSCLDEVSDIRSLAPQKRNVKHLSFVIHDVKETSLPTMDFLRKRVNLEAITQITLLACRDNLSEQLRSLYEYRNWICQLCKAAGSLEFLTLMHFKWDPASRFPELPCNLKTLYFRHSELPVSEVDAMLANSKKSIRSLVLCINCETLPMRDFMNLMAAYGSTLRKLYIDVWDAESEEEFRNQIEDLLDKVPKLTSLAVDFERCKVDDLFMTSLAESKVAQRLKHLQLSFMEGSVLRDLVEVLRNERFPVLKTVRCKSFRTSAKWLDEVESNLGKMGIELFCDMAPPL